MFRIVRLTGWSACAASTAALFLAGPAAAAPPQPEGTASPIRTVVLPVEVPVPMPVPAPYRNRDGETVRMALAAAGGALIILLVRRRPPRTRGAHPADLIIELSEVSHPSGK
jgi:hypothetical protein